MEPGQNDVKFLTHFRQGQNAWHFLDQLSFVFADMCFTFNSSPIHGPKKQNQNKKGYYFKEENRKKKYAKERIKKNTYLIPSFFLTIIC